MRTNNTACLVAAVLLAVPVASLAQRYTVTNLGTLGGTSTTGTGINEKGQVTGYSYFTVEGGSFSYSHAFLYTDGSMQDLGTLGGLQSTGMAINAAGQVTGQSSISGNNMWSHAFVYGNGTMRDLGTLIPGAPGSASSGGLGINASGQVVGESSYIDDLQGFIYSEGTMQALGTLDGAGNCDNNESSGTAINASGQATGQAASTVCVYHAFLYDAGTMLDLGALGGDESQSYGEAINDSGQVTGYSFTSSEGPEYHAFLYSNGTMQDLGTLGGNYSEGLAINASGTIVGMSYTARHAKHAFIYSDGHMIDLNTLISSTDAALYTLEYAQGINDKGQIVVNAGNVALLLTPIKKDFAGKKP
jgi:probable HAF family extracellular repeat protein